MTVLASDTTTRLCASLNGWAHPISVETTVLADLFDLTFMVNRGKGSHPKPHPIRPWPTGAETSRYGSTQGRTPAQVRSILAQARDGQMN